MSESLEMLEEEEGHLIGVFACFGWAAQHAQLFEEALVEFLTAYNRLCNKSVTLADLEPAAVKKQKKTLGVLLKEFDKFVTINPNERWKLDVRGLMATALEKRNFLIHRFFVERSDDLKTEGGRAMLLDELVGIKEELDAAATLTRLMYRAMCQTLEGANKDDALVPRDNGWSISFDVHVPD